ncbi:transposase [Alicyclobacillus sp. SP_1]|uniref:IS110 family transposase n=1 Tax=Alicyclobacillus sp. SP_1 TaxID=2942475 RepID=UPI0028050C90|nr:transposase [Alicyclobacillus sp. SP_1]
MRPSRTGRLFPLWGATPCPKLATAALSTNYCHHEDIHQISLGQAAVPCLERMKRCIRECCAGLDVHQANVVACVLKGSLKEKPQMFMREFPTVLFGLLELSDWVAELGCTEIAMESTGVYWKLVFNVLEATCTLTLANAAHIKNLHPMNP